MKILHCIRTLDPAYGGTVETVLQFASAQSAASHQPEIATLDDPAAGFLKEAPCPVHALGPGRGIYGYSPHYVPWLRKHAGDYDTVIVHGIWQFHSWGVWLAVRRRVPYSVLPQGMLDPWFKRTYPLKHAKKWLYWPWAEYRVLRDAHAVIFTCEEERVLARESFWLYRCRETIAHLGIRNPPDDAGAQKKALFSAFPKLAGKPFFLFLGRIHPKKACDVLLQAFARATREHPDQMLVMAGADLVGWQCELEELARREGIADRVIWTGLLRGECKWGALRSAEAMVLPSHQENFGIVVAESLACGTPVLISNKVNIWREIQIDDAGWIAEDAVEPFQNLLQKWMKTGLSAKEAMRANARSSFQRRFEIQHASDQLLQRIV